MAEVEAQIGVVGRRGRFTVVEPLFEPGRRLTIDARKRSDVDLGDIVLVRTRGRRAEIVRSIGRPDVARDVLEALLLDAGHERAFSEAVDGEARSAADGVAELARADLRSKPTFTIDPASAHDYDDAISIDRDGGKLRLYVHIADVAAYIAPGGALDREAERRGNSVYVPGAVEPMLPRILSNDACSLVAGKDRNTVTAEILLGEDGSPVKSSFYRSLINSDARLTYEQIDEVFAGRQQVPAAVAEELRLARALAATIRKRRFARGALAVETTEPDFEFDSRGHVRAAFDRTQTESHTLIEEFMILANEQVATQLERRKAPAIYRVHERPDPDAIERLVDQLASLDVPTPPLPERISAQQATELSGSISEQVTSYVEASGHGVGSLPLLVLRSLKQAVYSTHNIGHSGLASDCYCHFTSPIRRYPDLTVHRTLLAAFEGDVPGASAAELEEVALHCSQTEREAAKLEHVADDVCLAFLLEKVLFERGWDEPFEGEVSGVTHGAAFVRFGELPGGAACEGFLPARKLTGDWYDLNEQQTALVGRKSGSSVKIGDPISVSVRSVDPPRGRVDLEPAGDE